jgi:hypothetical protein
MVTSVRCCIDGARREVLQQTCVDEHGHDEVARVGPMYAIPKYSGCLAVGVDIPAFVSESANLFARFAPAAGTGSCAAMSPSSRKRRLDITQWPRSAACM